RASVSLSFSSSDMAARIAPTAADDQISLPRDEPARGGLELRSGASPHDLGRGCGVADHRAVSRGPRALGLRADPEHRAAAIAPALDQARLVGVVVGAAVA